MTVEQFQHALRISDNHLKELRSLSEALGQFDATLARESPGARALAGEAIDNQLRGCAEYVAKLTSMTPLAAEELIKKLLGPDLVSPNTTGTLSGLIFCYLVRKANP